MIQITINGQRHLNFRKEDHRWQPEEETADYDISWLPNGLIHILYKGENHTALVERVDFRNKELLLRINGRLYTAHIKEPMDQLLSSMGMDHRAQQKAAAIKAPMPGMVLKILVEAGQEIRKGDGLIVLEAMKMENILKAGSDGKVKAIKVTEKTAVEKGAVLIEME